MHDSRAGNKARQCIGGARATINPGGLSYSLRRYYVDQFYARQVATLAVGSRVLDIGGTKSSKRGRFDIGQYPVETVYCNLSPAKLHDVRCDAAVLPFADQTFDVVICAEVLEHVAEPAAVLHEMYRVLRPGGRVLASAPFLFRIHADPYDYGRYTDHCWRAWLSAAGFRAITLEKQGLFWSVLADMIRALAYQHCAGGRLKADILVRVCEAAVRRMKAKAIVWDQRAGLHDHAFYGSFTTGFGIYAEK